MARVFAHAAPSFAPLAFAAAAFLGGCATNAPAPVVDLSGEAKPPSAAPPVRAAVRDAGEGTYRVVAGDTLYAIAFKHGVDFRDIAAWNHIVPPYRIYAGQELRLRAPDAAASRAAAGGAPARASAPAAVVSRPAAAKQAPPAPAKPAAAMFEDVPASGEPVPVHAPAAQARTDAAAAKPGAAAVASEEKPTSAAAAAPPPAATPAPPAAAPAHVAASDSVAVAPNGIAWRWPGKGSLVGTYVAGDQTRQGIDIAGQSGDPVLAAADGEVVYSGNGLLGYGELIIIKHNAAFLSAYGHNRRRLVQEGQKIKAGQQIAEMGSSASARDELHFEIRKNGKPVNPLDYLPAR